MDTFVCGTFVCGHPLSADTLVSGNPCQRKPLSVDTYVCGTFVSGNFVCGHLCLWTPLSADTFVYGHIVSGHLVIVHEIIFIIEAQRTLPSSFEKFVNSPLKEPKVKEMGGG